MKMRNILMTGIVCLATTVMAEYAPPTDAQIQAAAADPTQLAALLTGASPEEAAHVVKMVIVKITALNLSPTILEGRINQEISAAVTSLPATSQNSFATQLGSEIGGSLAIRSQTTVVSQIQGAIASSGGAAAAQAFGTSFQTASSGTGNTKSGKDQPPTTKLYPGQN